MVTHVVTPNTFSKRGKKIHVQSNDYTEWVSRTQKKHHADSISILKRIEKSQTRIARFKNLSPNEIMRREALFINRQASYLTDNVINAEYGIKKYGKMHPKTKSDIWAQNFSKVMDRLVLPKIKNPKLKSTIEKMDLYFSLPENIHKRRGSDYHWPRLKKIRNKIIRSGENPRENMLKAMDKILSKRKPGETYKVKAMDVCVAASIYADILRKTKQARWTQAYREGMEIAYSKISIDEKLVEAIIALSKANQQKAN